MDYGKSKCKKSQSSFTIGCFIDATFRWNSSLLNLPAIAIPAIEMQLHY